MFPWLPKGLVCVPRPGLESDLWDDHDDSTLGSGWCPGTRRRNLTMTKVKRKRRDDEASELTTWLCQSLLIDRVWLIWWHI